MCLTKALLRDHVMFPGGGHEVGCARRGNRRSHDHGALHARNHELPATVDGPQFRGESRLVPKRSEHANYFTNLHYSCKISKLALLGIIFLII